MRNWSRLTLLIVICLGAFMSGHGLWQAATLAQEPVYRLRPADPNLLAPDLYADQIETRFILVDLPGANVEESTWEVSYQLYFIPEAEFDKAIENARQRLAPQGGRFLWDPRPDDFPVKTLLDEGQMSKTGLATITDRVFSRGGISFKSKVPDAERMKMAHLLLSYSVRIFDGRLKEPLTREGVHLYFPFDDEPNPWMPRPREILFANFYLTLEGKLFTSMMPRSAEDTTWNLRTRNRQ